METMQPPSPSKSLKPPVQATVDIERGLGLSRLWFDDASIAPGGDYRMVGGICWPLLVGDVFRGCAVLAGMDIKTEIIYLFEQREFSCIEHVIVDGAIVSHGLAPWFVENWARYYAHRYYWFQCDEYNQTFRLRVSRCEIIQPKPALIETHWSDDTHAQLIISDALERRKLRIRSGSPVESELNQQQADPKMGPFPALHALACALTSLGRRRLPKIEN